MYYLVHKQKLETHGIIDTLQIIVLIIILKLIQLNREFIQHLSLCIKLFSVHFIKNDTYNR